jgi:hypothetical protein
VVEAASSGQGSRLSGVDATAPCVIHLVRAANGLDPFRAFLESYDRHPAGIPHELVLVLKGFPTLAAAEPFLQLAGSRVSETVSLADEGRDLTAYFAAAAQLRRDRYCFLNSFSEVLADGWLKLLHAALDDPAVGLAGATASWASISSLLRFELGLGGPYRGLLGRPAQARTLLMNHDAQTSASREQRASRVAAVAALPGRLLSFPRFPNHHVRTNAFMLSSEVLTRLGLAAVRKQTDGYRLESGRRSITRQVEQLGLRAVVVARNGVVHDVPDWAASGVLWQRRQEGLLVADNQTRNYDRASAEVRRLLSRYAWGELAEPS